MSVYSRFGLSGLLGSSGGGMGGGFSSLLQQLQNATNPESDQYDPEMRTHLAIEHLGQLCERLSLVQSGQKRTMTLQQQKQAKREI